MPTIKAQAKSLNIVVPKTRNAKTERRVKALVSNVLDKVWLMEMLKTSIRGVFFMNFRFSLILSHTTMVSLMSYPIIVSIAAKIVRLNSLPVHTKKPVYNNYVMNQARYGAQPHGERETKSHVNHQ